MNFDTKNFEIPLIISRQTVVFPKEVKIFKITRDFSLNAIKDSKDNFESYCVMVTQIDETMEDIHSFEDIYKVGTLTKVDFEQSTNTLNVDPINRVKIIGIEFKDDHFIAKCELYPDKSIDIQEEKELIERIVTSINSDTSKIMFSIEQGSPRIKQLQTGMTAEALSYFLSDMIMCEPHVKQQLLEAESLSARFKILLEIIEDFLQFNEIDKKIMQNVQDSADKQQKDYYLREKLKAIKKELGEDGSSSNETIEEKLNNYPYPEEVKTKIRDELKRKELMPQGSLENSLIQDYIDITLSVPWFESTVDNDDIKHAQEILDEDHYGLKQVKDRIIEYLAVKKVKGNLKAPILCFYGPPGCGKTSLSRSIARALDRKFIKCSLGGVSDEAEIRGHRRTYVGSRPGRIISLLRKAKANNPVFLLDEIDKLSHDSFKGDPASALLEVLDPEQNHEFADNYLELNYDLSHCLFICTANNIESIPTALLDRLELIQVPSYTTLDKLHIAKDFLIKKEEEANGLTDEQVEFTDDGIFYVIDRYTRESGVRSLERALSSILRKIIVQNLKNGNTEKIVVGPEEVVKYLGAETFDSSSKEKGSQIGVVTGLAYTQYGGEILPIEVNYFSGKGKLILTGKLGDVMKESCTIALDYVKSNAVRYSIDPKLFEENDIHVHVPEGAVPKDGPSAGVAITIAIISALSKKPVSGNIAMTGEVTLRGNALPIGGLREKSMAAMRHGIKKIIVPEGNKRNVNELPKEVTSKLKIVYMKNVDDACKVIFK